MLKKSIFLICVHQEQVVSALGRHTQAPITQTQNHPLCAFPCAHMFNLAIAVYFCADFAYNISAKVVMELNAQDRISVIASANHGILKTADVVAAGISKKALAEFVKDRGFERAAHGIYCDPDAWTDEMLVLQLRCPKTIFSHDTALFLHDLTDREPLTYTVTAKTGYNPSHLTETGVKVYTVKKELFEIGMMNSLTPFGNCINIYNMERTICDVIRSRSTIEAQVFQDALKQYAKRTDKNLYQLMEYANLFHVDRILRQYMEVLL